MSESQTAPQSPLSTVSKGESVSLKKRVETVKGAPYHITNIRRFTANRVSVITTRRRRKHGYRIYISSDSTLRIFRTSDIREMKEEDIVSLLRYLYSNIPTSLQPIGEEGSKLEYLFSDYSVEFGDTPIG